MGVSLFSTVIAVLVSGWAFLLPVLCCVGHSVVSVWCFAAAAALSVEFSLEDFVLFTRWCFWWVQWYSLYSWVCLSTPIVASTAASTAASASASPSSPRD